MTGSVRERGIPAPLSWSAAELALAGVLLALAAVAWLLSGGLAMPDMRVGILTGMPSGAGADDQGGPVQAALFLLTWMVMMTAMMLPGITSFTVGVSRLVRPGAAALAVLTAGYLLVWSASGVLAYAVLRGFDAFAMSGEAVRTSVGGGALLLAGIYQFSPLKQWCLVRCRSPLALVVRYGERVARSRTGALAVGTRHGGYCLGCCWALMVVLLAAGAMSLVWMAAVAAVITVEKVLPHERTFTALLGGLLIALGVFVLVTPALMA